MRLSHVFFCVFLTLVTVLHAQNILESDISISSTTEPGTPGAINQDLLVHFCNSAPVSNPIVDAQFVKVEIRAQFTYRFPLSSLPTVQTGLNAQGGDKIVPVGNGWASGAKLVAPSWTPDASGEYGILSAKYQGANSQCKCSGTSTGCTVKMTDVTFPQTRSVLAARVYIDPSSITWSNFPHSQNCCISPGGESEELHAIYQVPAVKTLGIPTPSWKPRDPPTPSYWNDRLTNYYTGFYDFAGFYVFDSPTPGAFFTTPEQDVVNRQYLPTGFFYVEPVDECVGIGYAGFIQIARDPYNARDRSHGDHECYGWTSLLEIEGQMYSEVWTTNGNSGRDNALFVDFKSESEIAAGEVVTVELLSTISMDWFSKTFCHSIPTPVPDVPASHFYPQSYDADEFVPEAYYEFYNAEHDGWYYDRNVKNYNYYLDIGWWPSRFGHFINQDDFVHDISNANHYFMQYDEDNTWCKSSLYENFFRGAFHFNKTDSISIQSIGWTGVNQQSVSSNIPSVNFQNGPVRNTVSFTSSSALSANVHRLFKISGLRNPTMMPTLPWIAGVGTSTHREPWRNEQPIVGEDDFTYYQLFPHPTPMDHDYYEQYYEGLPVASKDAWNSRDPFFYGKQPPGFQNVPIYPAINRLPLDWISVSVSTGKAGRHPGTQVPCLFRSTWGLLANPFSWNDPTPAYDPNPEASTEQSPEPSNAWYWERSADERVSQMTDQEMFESACSRGDAGETPSVLLVDELWHTIKDIEFQCSPNLPNVNTNAFMQVKFTTGLVGAEAGRHVFLYPPWAMYNKIADMPVVKAHDTTTVANLFIGQADFRATNPLSYRVSVTIDGFSDGMVGLFRRYGFSFKLLATPSSGIYRMQLAFEAASGNVGAPAPTPTPTPFPSPTPFSMFDYYHAPTPTPDPHLPQTIFKPWSHENFYYAPTPAYSNIAEPYPTPAGYYYGTDQDAHGPATLPTSGRTAFEQKFFVASGSIITDVTGVASTDLANADNVVITVTFHDEGVADVDHEWIIHVTDEDPEQLTRGAAFKVVVNNDPTLASYMSSSDDASVVTLRVLKRIAAGTHKVAMTFLKGPPAGQHYVSVVTTASPKLVDAEEPYIIGGAFVPGSCTGFNGVVVSDGDDEDEDDSTDCSEGDTIYHFCFKITKPMYSMSKVFVSFYTASDEVFEYGEDSDLFYYEDFDFYDYQANDEMVDAVLNPLQKTQFGLNFTRMGFDGRRPYYNNPADDYPNRNTYPDSVGCQNTDTLGQYCEFLDFTFTNITDIKDLHLNRVNSAAMVPANSLVCFDTTNTQNAYPCAGEVGFVNSQLFAGISSSAAFGECTVNLKNKGAILPMGVNKLWGRDVSNDLELAFVNGDFLDNIFGARVTVQAPGQASNLVVQFTMKEDILFGNRAYVYMPGWAGAIANIQTPVNSCVGRNDDDASSVFYSTPCVPLSTFDSKEILTVAMPIAANQRHHFKFAVSVIANPAANDYYFSMWAANYHSHRTMKSPLKIFHSIYGVAVTLSDNVTSRKNAAMTFSFKSSAPMSSQTTLVFTFRGPSTMAPTNGVGGIPSNPIVRAVDGFGEVTVRYAVFVRDSQSGGVLTVSLTAPATNPNAQSTAGSTLVLELSDFTTPTIGGAYSVSIRQNAFLPGVGTFKINGILSDLIVAAWSGASGREELEVLPAQANTFYSFSFTNSAPMMEDDSFTCIFPAAFQAVWTTTFPDNWCETSWGPDLSLRGSYGCLMTDKTVWSRSANKMVFTLDDDVPANEPVQFLFESTRNSPAAGAYVISCSTTSAPSSVAASAPLVFGGVSDVTVSLGSTLGGALNTFIVITFTHNSELFAGKKIYYYMGKYGSSIVAKPDLVPQPGFDSTINDWVYNPQLNVLEVTIGDNMPVDKVTSLQISVAQNPAAGSIHSIGVSTDASTIPVYTSALIRMFGTLEDPVVSSVSPAKAESYTQQRVTLVGTNFGYGDEDLSIRYGEAANPLANVCNQPTFISTTSVSCVTSNGPFAATYLFVVTVAGKSSAAKGSLTFSTVKPFITSIYPTHAPANKGIDVTLYGVNFAAKNLVVSHGPGGLEFSCTSPNYVSASQVVCQSANNVAAGAVHRFQLSFAQADGTVLTSPLSTTLFQTGFPFIGAQADRASAISPTSGPARTGTRVLLKGYSFGAQNSIVECASAPASQCDRVGTGECTGAVACTDAEWISEQSVSCTTADSVAQADHVFSCCINAATDNELCSEWSLDAFAFRIAPSTVTASSVAFGQAGVSQSIVLTGSGFSGSAVSVATGVAGAVATVTSHTDTTVSISLTSATNLAGVSLSFTVTVDTVVGVTSSNTLFAFRNVCSSHTCSGTKIALAGSTVCTRAVCTDDDCCDSSGSCVGKCTGVWVPKLGATCSGSSCSTNTDQCCVKANLSDNETVSGSGTNMYNSESFQSTNPSRDDHILLDCNRYSEVEAENIQLKVVMGTFTDYFRPVTGGRLCDVLTSSDDRTKMWSQDGITFVPSVNSDSRLLGGGAPASATRPFPVGPFWGNAGTVSDVWLGGCGHAAANTPFVCGLPFTLTVSVRASFVRYATFDGTMKIDGETYAQGVVSVGNVAQSCHAYDTFSVSNSKNSLYFRVTMGQYVDYFRAVSSLCASIQSGAWYYHSFSANGPWKAVNGNHSALLGGWNTYPDDASDPSYASVGFVDYRIWGSFLGAVTGPAGYHEEPGGCCHKFMLTAPIVTEAQARLNIRFGRAFFIDVKTVVAP